MVKDNTVTGGDAGIVVTGGSPHLVGNTVERVTGRGIVVGLRASPTLTGNTACGNGVNLFVADNADPVIDETNEICMDAPAE